MHNQQVILSNPFHPLDLSPEDLLRIYKRFQQSQTINKNPNQQLSIDTISQLISSLKGIKPSYVQKCISQSFIKKMISWNDFLMLLDQQSQIRENILTWVLYQQYTFNYKLKKYITLKHFNYDFVTFMNLITINNQHYSIIQFDSNKFVLAEIHNNTFKAIDQYEKKNSKSNLQIKQIPKPTRIVQQSKIFQSATNSKRFNNPMKNQSERLINHNSINSGNNLKSSQLGIKEDQETYLNKQKKNIHSVFNVFKDLQIDDSIGLAKITAGKLTDRTFNFNYANSVRENLSHKIIPREQVIKNIGSRILTPYESARNKLKSLYQQKSKLSYNPYRVKRIQLQSREQKNYSFAINDKKLNHQRKQKQYVLSSMAITFNQQINCLGVAYHNFQILILKLAKDLNKMAFQQQDTIKLELERDHKKNQIIQSIKFYYHSIRAKWFLLVLLRVEYKVQGKSQPQSILLGYQVQQIQNKRKGGFNYRFKANFDMSFKKQTFSVVIPNFQAIKMQVQQKYGIHMISFNGKYLTYREQYIPNDINSNLSIYWRLGTQQKFKNNTISLSCLSIGQQIDKVLFGTSNGNIILYDTFSHKFKIKKIANTHIVKVHIVGKQGYVLTHQQKFFIIALQRFQEIVSFSTINQDKLHQKVLSFLFYPKTKEIWTFGSQIKIYDQQTDQSQLHKMRQMQKTYTWRLSKLKNQISPNDELKSRIQTKFLTSSKLSKGCQLTSSQLIISSEKYFIILSKILQIIVIQKLSMKVKFTFILNIPYDQKVLKMALSSNEKLLAVLLFNQSIYIYNIYTQQLYKYIKSPQNVKFISLTFLDQKNQYLIAAGTQSGKIGLIPYSSVPEKPIFYLNYHTRPVNLVQVKENSFISCGEGGKIGIWQLPFNTLKNQLKIPKGISYISKVIGSVSNKLFYVKSMDDQVFQISLLTSKITKINFPTNFILNRQAINVMAVDSLTNELFVGSSSNLTIFTRPPNQFNWVLKHKVQIYEKNIKKLSDESPYGQIIEIGVIPSQKAIIFYQGGGAFVYSYQTQKVGKYITFE